jgi:tetratricopeptide (TPR) repeat protein
VTRSRNAAGDHPLIVVCAAGALAGAIGLQMVRDRVYTLDDRETQRLLYVRSGAVLKRVVLEFDALAADTYWIRAIQHYGGERLAKTRGRNYELLYPLLDLTTDLDPYFTLAYRFGAIFLSEPYPGGPGRPDQAIALLRKGIAAQPEKWQYLHDLAFVHYWQLHDPKAAADWFLKASRLPNAPDWLQPVAASMLSQRDRASARFLWQQILQSDQEWLRRTAERSLMQLQALDDVEQLQDVVTKYPPPSGAAFAWEDYVSRRIVRAIPTDPTGEPYSLDAGSGEVRVAPRSSLNPMPKLRAAGQ